jgi:hypothetical protein
LGTGLPASYGFTGGQIHGLPVYTDGGIALTYSNGPTGGEDVVIVANRSDLLLFEDGATPREFRFEEPGGGELTVKLVVAGYSAFTAKWHPEGVARITGSSLLAPTF